MPELSPVVPVLGVFFPVWIFCAIGGVLASVAIRAVVIRLHGAPVPGLGAVFYSALAVLVAVGSYLVWTGGLS